MDKLRFAVLVLLASACGNDSSAPVVFDARTRPDARPSAPDAVPAIDAPLVIADAPPLIDAAPPPDAGPTVFHVTLTKEAQVPLPCVNAGGSATGTATVTIDPAGTSIAVTGLEYSGLSEAVASAAHIHFGATGTNGAVVLPFLDPASPITQTFTAADYIVPAVGPQTFPAFVAEMKAGHSYLNVHTGPTHCPDGEIRGQIQ